MAKEAAKKTCVKNVWRRVCGDERTLYVSGSPEVLAPVFRSTTHTARAGLTRGCTLNQRCCSAAAQTGGFLWSRVLRTLTFCHRLFGLALLSLPPWIRFAFFSTLEVGGAHSRGLIQHSHQFGMAAIPLPILASFEVSYQLIRGCALRYCCALSEILSGQLQPAWVIFSGQDGDIRGVATEWGRGRLLGTASESGSRHHSDHQLPHEQLPRSYAPSNA